METRRGRRAAVTTLCTCLWVLTFATTTGCDAVQAEGGQLGAFSTIPILADLSDTVSGRLLTMDVETVEDEEFEYGSPLE